jgi:cytochrome c2
VTLRPSQYSAAIRWSALFVCVVIGLVAGAMFQKYVGLPMTLAFVKSPMAELRILRRDWNSSEQLQYTAVSHAPGDDLLRYVETGLLPLIIDEKPLSASYPVTKFGGAIAVVDHTVIIVDRLGSFFKYDLASNSFGQLQLPVLPNNLAEYLHRRANLDGRAEINLAGIESEGEFRVYDVTYLPDRQALAVAYDQFDSTLGKLRTAVSILPIDPISVAATDGWRTIFTSDPYAPGSSFFGGGRMAYRGNDKLYLTLGDHAIYDPKVAQDSKTTFGKIIEIDLNTEKWQEVSKGHRNPQGLTFLESGALVATEHGPAGGDGLELIAEGSNFGWPNVTLGTAYDSYDLGVGVGWGTTSSIVGSIVGYTPPMFAWMPSIAVSQLIEIENFSPRWNGDLLVGSLKASSLYRIRLQGDRVLYSEPIWIGQRIRDLAQAPDGTIILWTDNAQLLLITVDKTKLTQNRRNTAFLGEIGTAGCMSCHHFGPTHPGDPAPSLSNLLNRRIASDAFPYSPGLRARNQEHWTKALLTEFLNDPEKFAAGTPMSAARVFGLNPERIGNIVDELARVSPEPQ